MDNLSIFAERLNELTFDRAFTPEMLSKYCKVKLSTVYRWKKSDGSLYLSNLIALADALECSIDFLLGRSNEVLPFVPQKNLPVFYDRLRELMKEKGISTYRLRQISRYDGNYMKKWKNGADILAFTLVELCDVLNVSADYLIGREN